MRLFDPGIVLLGRICRIACSESVYSRRGHAQCKHKLKKKTELYDSTSYNNPLLRERKTLHEQHKIIIITREFTMREFVGLKSCRWLLSNTQNGHVS